MKNVLDAVNEYEAIAPEPCYAENKSQIIMAAKSFDGFLFGDLTTGDGVRDNEYWKVICTREEFNQCVKECSDNFGQTKSPVYTQAMSDANELPPIGVHTKLKVSSEYFINRCSLAGESVYVTSHFKTNGGKDLCAYVNAEETQGGVAASCAFEATDTRTDSEKAIDDIENFLTKDRGVHTEESYNIAEGIFNLISDSDVHGVTFTGES